MTETEVAPNIPPDWRDWINEFPSIKSVALTCVIGWITTPILMTIEGALIAKGYITDQKAIEAIERLISIWLDALNWLTLAAVFGVVTKRATEKPEVIRAEGEAKAAAIAAAQPTIAAAPSAPVAPSPVAMVGDVAAQLAAESRAKAQRQAGTSFEGG